MCIYVNKYCRQDSSSAGGGGAVSGNSAESRVLATMLTEMDGIDVGAKDLIGDANGDTAMCGVIVIAATNRIDAIDAALLRKVQHRAVRATCSWSY